MGTKPLAVGSRSNPSVAFAEATGKPSVAFARVTANEKTVDRALIEGCMREERRAQQALYEAMHSRLMNVCLRYTRDEEEARSHFVQGFLKILTNLRLYNFDGAFESWASRVMINSIIDTLRSKKRYNQTIALVDADTMTNNDVSWNEFELRCAAEDVLNLVKKLPDATRAVFMLYAVDGYAHQEIASMLNIAEGTSKWHVSDARRRLVDLINDFQKRNSNYGTQR